YANAAELMIDGSVGGQLVLRSNPGDRVRTKVTINYLPRMDSHGRTLFEISGIDTDTTPERTTLAVRRMVRYAAEHGLDGVVVRDAGPVIAQTDPNWKRNGDYVVRDVATGVNFRARLVPQTNTAFISMIYLPPSRRGSGE